MYLYEIVLVDTDHNIVVLDNNSVVARDEEDAKYMAGVYNALSDLSQTPADVTIIVTNKGHVHDLED